MIIHINNSSSGSSDDDYDNDSNNNNNNDRHVFFVNNNCIDTYFQTETKNVSLCFCFSTSKVQFYCF
jgi:hypothetical protein